MMQLNLESNPTLLITNVILMTLTAVAAVVSVAILVLTLRRRDHVLSLDDSPLARITYRRAVRNEGAYGMCQMILLVMSIWALWRVLPEAPPKAIAYYFATQAGRTIISMILVLSLGFDLWDRSDIKAILDEMDRKRVK